MDRARGQFTRARARSSQAGYTHPIEMTIFPASLHSQLADCGRLFLRNYQVGINIGVYDFDW
jgi:hypothetical protein